MWSTSHYLFFIVGSYHAGGAYEENNGFYVTPDGLFVPQQFMYYNGSSEQQFPATAPVVDNSAVKDMIRKQMYVSFC